MGSVFDEFTDSESSSESSVSTKDTLSLWDRPDSEKEARIPFSMLIKPELRRYIEKAHERSGKSKSRVAEILIEKGMIQLESELNAANTESN